VTPEHGVSLAPHTSLRVGGPADHFVLARSALEVAEALRWARDHALPARILGGGSNLLVSDVGVEGVVIKALYAQASVEERLGEPVLVAEAGVNLANQARRLAKRGLAGLEWAANVPGTVGGAVVNNAGAFGGDTASCLLGVVVVDPDGHERQLTPDELGYAYRTSVLKRRELGDVAVARALLRLARSTPATTDGKVKEFNAQRMRTQPRILSAGSVFANPEGTYSGKLIEEAGLKGARAGGAQISEQHANFIVNHARATAHDVYTLMRQAQDMVFERTGVWLRAEIEVIGRWPADELAALAGHSHYVAGGRALQRALPEEDSSPRTAALDAHEAAGRG
jgi:UDP-N-acetylmuramate dehydrogenase